MIIVGWDMSNGFDQILIAGSGGVFENLTQRDLIYLDV